MTLETRDLMSYVHCNSNVYRRCLLRRSSFTACKDSRALLKEALHAYPTQSVRNCTCICTLPYNYHTASQPLHDPQPGASAGTAAMSLLWLDHLRRGCGIEHRLWREVCKLQSIFRAVEACPHYCYFLAAALVA